MESRRCVIRPRIWRQCSEQSASDIVLHTLRLDCDIILIRSPESSTKYRSSFRIYFGLFGHLTYPWTGGTCLTWKSSLFLARFTRQFSPGSLPRKHLLPKLLYHSFLNFSTTPSRIPSHCCKAASTDQLQHLYISGFRCSSSHPHPLTLQPTNLHLFLYNLLFTPLSYITPSSRHENELFCDRTLSQSTPITRLTTMSSFTSMAPSSEIKPRL